MDLYETACLCICICVFTYVSMYIHMYIYHHTRLCCDVSLFRWLARSSLVVVVRFVVVGNGRIFSWRARYAQFGCSFCCCCCYCILSWAICLTPFLPPHCVRACGCVCARACASVRILFVCSLLSSVCQQPRLCTNGNLLTLTRRSSRQSHYTKYRMSINCDRCNVTVC